MLLVFKNVFKRLLSCLLPFGVAQGSAIIVKIRAITSSELVPNMPLHMH